MNFPEFRKKFPHFLIHTLEDANGIDISLTEEDLLQDLKPESMSNRFLGRFSQDEVSKALEKYGIWKSLADTGYPQPRLVIQSTDPFRQSVRIWTTQNAPEADDNLLCELRVYSGQLHARDPEPGPQLEMDALVIDWLQFQNPAGTFTSDRPPLPGQRYPGLGILRPALKAILDLAIQVEKDAILTTPEYYHNAVLYHPNFLFFSPEFEGLFRALRTFFSNKSLAEASRMVTEETVLRSGKGCFQWASHEQIHAISPEIIQYFSSKQYRSRVQKYENTIHFQLKE